MATAKPAQKAAKTTTKAKTPALLGKPAKRPSEPTYTMPREVSDWIERASSTMNHLKGEVARLKAENVELKAYKKWAEHRILRSDHE